jgi:hypothetical protein
MEEIKKYLKDCCEGLDDTMVVSRKTLLLEVLVGFLSGVVLGILLAPPKYRKVGCDNGNNCVGKYQTDTYGEGGCGCGCNCDCDEEKKDEE